MSASEITVSCDLPINDRGKTDHSPEQSDVERGSTCTPISLSSSVSQTSDSETTNSQLSSDEYPDKQTDKEEAMNKESDVNDSDEKDKEEDNGEWDSVDEDANSYEGLRIPVTSAEYPTTQYLEILETLSGSTAGTFRVQAVDEGGEAGKSNLINEGKRFILKVYAPEFTQNWSDRHYYTLSPALQQVFEASVHDGSYQNFVDSLQTEIPESNIPAEILEITTFRPIRKVDILWRCYRYARHPYMDYLDIAVKAKLLLPEETLPPSLLMLQIHISRCQFTKEITVLEKVAPLVHNHLPKKIGLFKQQIWWTPPGQLKLDCIAMEEIRGYTFEQFITNCSDANDDPGKMDFPVSELASHSTTNIERFYSSVTELLHILPAIGYVQDGARNPNNILVRMDDCEKFVDLCFVDAASLFPLKSSRGTAEIFGQYIDITIKRADLCSPTTIRISGASFGGLLIAQNPNPEVEDELFAGIYSVFKHVSRDVHMSAEQFGIPSFQDLQNKRDALGWQVIMLATLQASCGYHDSLYLWRLFAASLMRHHKVDALYRDPEKSSPDWLRSVLGRFKIFTMKAFGSSPLDCIGEIYKEFDTHATRLEQLSAQSTNYFSLRSEVYRIALVIAESIELFPPRNTLGESVSGQELWEAMDAYLHEEDIKLVHPCCEIYRSGAKVPTE